MGSLHYWEPGTAILFYDLGLSLAARSEVARWEGVTVIDPPWVAIGLGEEGEDSGSGEEEDETAASAAASEVAAAAAAAAAAAVAGGPTLPQRWDVHGVSLEQVGLAPWPSHARDPGTYLFKASDRGGRVVLVGRARAG